MSSSKRFFGIVILLALIAAPFVVWRQWNAIYDWSRLRDYSPPADVVSLADQDTFNAYTKHLFYVNHPQLLSTVTSFRQYCPENENTIVLGCYHPDQDGIYIYNVQDPSLAGVAQVTAAHEVLHSIYARLSTKDRAALDSELQDYYQNDLHDQRVLAEVALYQQTEPNSVMDEMSCTFGTEIASLPSPLEAYYSRYFNNRQAIVAFEQNYEGEFTSRTNQINAYDAQLAALKQQISNEESTLSAQLNQINSDRARLDSQRNSGDIGGYNAGVDSFNSEVDSYNSGLNQLQANISDYNNLVTTRNSIAGELETLDQAIDTRLTTQSAQ